MTTLKSIWQNANDPTLKIDNLLKMNQVTAIYIQLKKEEERRKKWLPWMISYFIGMTLFLLWIYNWISQTWYDRSLSTLQIMGTLLILVGAFVMFYLNQLHKIPLAAYEHDQTSRSFLTVVKKQLVKRRKMHALSNGIYIFILTIALNIIGYDWSAPYAAGNWSSLWLLNGFMLLLAAIAIPLGLRNFDKKYKDILNRTDQFLTP